MREETLQRDEREQAVTHDESVTAEPAPAPKAEVDAWGDMEGEDLERLRTAIRRYRNLLDQLLGR